MKCWRGTIGWLLLVVLASASGRLAVGQQDPTSAASGGERAARSSSELQSFNKIGGLPALPGLDSGGGELELAGEFSIEKDARIGKLAVTAKMLPGWHVYSLAQPPGGPQRSKLDVKPSPQFKLTGDFQPDRDPKIKHVEFWSVPAEEHHDQVVWTAPLELAGDVDPQDLTIELVYNGQVCDEGSACIPIINKSIEAKFAGYYEAPQAGEYRAETSHATISGYLSPDAVAPGDTVKLVLTASPEPPWHVYAYEKTDPELIAKPALIALSRRGDWVAGDVAASSEPVTEEILPNEPPVSYHEGPVSWTLNLKVPADTEPGKYEVAGLIGYQTCTDTGCDPPTAAEFRGAILVGTALSAEQSPLTFSPTDYDAAAKLAAEAAAPKPQESAQTQLDLNNLQTQVSDQANLPLPLILLVALLGGFILNFMPCVLPVIGLKVMSFVQQAGEHRSRVLALNAWYAVGLVSVFLVLATMATAWNFGWGEQFNFDTFNIVMAAVVFVMGLSFLGVWEIPIPGFMGSGKANELAEKEGPGGAFAKGVVTTILATPCSGPGLATALAWCNGKPAYLVYAVFAVMGLGMAAPYLVLGANPKLIRFLPKPGAWMETFKQLMGFVLLGTVVFLLTFVQWPNILPTLALLFGLWTACWWIGRTPITAQGVVKVRAWAGAALFAVLIGVFAFGERFFVGDYTLYGLRGMMEYRFAASVDNEIARRQTLDPDELQLADGASREEPGYELPWERFSPDKLQALAAENKTVLVDFTAKWCLTCKALEQGVLNTRDIKEVVEKNGVVPLIADWSNYDPEISKLLNSLGSKQVPVLAIFPAGRPNEPIVLIGGYTKSKLIDRLEQAGPSHSAASEASGYELSWEPFSSDKLKAHVAENKTVLVNFTAEWDLASKVLEDQVLNTADVKEVVEKNDVVSLAADWSDEDADVGNLLTSLFGRKEVPVLAIFPAGRSNEPIVLSGGFTKSKLIDSLEQAGPSQSPPSEAATAMN